MTSTFSRVILALGLAIVGMPAVAGAQEEGKSSESETAESTTEADDGSSTSDDKTSAEGDEAKADSGDGSGGDGAKAGNADEQNADKTAEKGQSEDGEADGEQVGPGGKKMRTDYPADEKAKQKKMETDRIEGLQFDEGEDPSGAYNVEIQELETKIDDLKEKVFQSKSRVVLLKETVLGGNLSGSRAVIVHNDKLGGRFKLQRAMYSMDGNRVFNESQKTGKLPASKKFKVYDDSLTTGQHNVSVLLEYQGSGYGIFNYMKGYRFKITSSCQFTAKAGKLTTLTVMAVNKSGALSDVEKQPGIQCEIQTTDLTDAKVESSTDDDGSSGGEGSEDESSGTGAGSAEESGGASSSADNAGE